MVSFGNSLGVAGPAGAQGVAGASGAQGLINSLGAVGIQGPQGFAKAAGPPVAGYVAWYDASDITSITSSAGAVSQWNDKSVSGYHLIQSTGVNKPVTGSRTQNSLNLIDFDGLLSYMLSSFTVSGVRNAKAMTIISVVVPDRTNAVSEGVLGLVRSGAGDIYDFIHDRRSSNKNSLAYGDGLGGTAYAAFGGGSLGTSAYCQSISIQGITPTLYINGSSVSLNQYGGFSPTFMNSTPTDQAVIVGSRYPAPPTGCFDGALAEFVVYPSVLGTTDRQSVEAYLKAKWATP